MSASPDLPINPWSERLRRRLGDRAIGLGVAVLVQALLLLALLSLGQGIIGEKDQPNLVSISPSSQSEEAAPTEEAEPPQVSAATRAPTPEPVPLPTVAPLPIPPPPAAVVPRPTPVPPPPAPAPRAVRMLPPGQTYGPAAPGRNSRTADSQRVGTAPNGEPLYAARWYREPAEDELRGYLSTASLPAWGIVACRTAPDYRVEDCVGLEESPAGSNMLRAILAATWQFKVRPARIGGRELVGSWVRIKIDIRRE